MKIILSKHHGKMEMDMKKLKYLVITLAWKLVGDEISPVD